jgi:hypothetical protein
MSYAAADGPDGGPDAPVVFCRRWIVGGGFRTIIPNGAVFFSHTIEGALRLACELLPPATRARLGCLCGAHPAEMVFACEPDWAVFAACAPAPAVM